MRFSPTTTTLPSSANLKQLVQLLTDAGRLLCLRRSEIKMMKSRGDNTDPCGTPRRRQLLLGPQYEFTRR